MKTLKKLLLVIPVLILAVSCGEDFTVLAPQSQRNVENFYKTDTDFETSINGAYAGLAGSKAYGRNLMLFFEMRSDNTENDGGATGLAESLQQIDRFDEITTATEVEDTWAGGYEIIARTNTILNRIEGATFDNPALGERIRGEALFIRSLVYYNLAVAYGNIAEQFDEVTSPNVDINQVAADVIYARITNDLEDAVSLLPSSYSGGNIGRATSGAASTLLGLVHLTNGENGQAEAAFRSVVQSNQYELIPDYEDIWGVENQNNEESIFEIQYKSGGQGTGSPFTEYYSPDLSISGGVGGGNAPQLIPEELVTVYENDDDRQSTLEIADDDGEPYLNKYDGTQFAAFDGDNNFIVFRYADVLLMLAEAIGESSESIDLIDEVRERAGLTTSVADLPGSFSDKLLAERQREFVGENKRWPDLLRFGVAEQVMSDFLADEGVDPDDVRLLFPIPQREIDSSSGDLTQNPGIL